MTRPSSIKSKYPNLPPGYLAEDEQVPLAKLGCSELSWTPSAREVLNASSPRDFSFTASFLPRLAFGLTATLAAGLLAYGVVRAIGWVIGGFLPD
jgi:hypothetical protein